MPSHFTYNERGRRIQFKPPPFSRALQISGIIQQGERMEKLYFSPPPFFYCLNWEPSISVCLSSKHSWPLPSTMQQCFPLSQLLISKPSEPERALPNVSVGDSRGTEWETEMHVCFHLFQPVSLFREGEDDALELPQNTTLRPCQIPEASCLIWRVIKDADMHPVVSVFTITQRFTLIWFTLLLAFSAVLQSCCHWGLLRIQPFFFKKNLLLWLQQVITTFHSAP